MHRVQGLLPAASGQALPPELIQISVARTMLGASTFEAWRVDAEGRAAAPP